MNHEEARAVLRGIRYKRGWTIQIDGCRFRWHADVDAGLVDRDDPSRKVEIVGQWWELWQYDKPQDVLDHALLGVFILEDHETREMFTYVGTRPYDPHAHGVAMRIQHMRRDHSLFENVTLETSS